MLNICPVTGSVTVDSFCEWALDKQLDQMQVIDDYFIVEHQNARELANQISAEAGSLHANVFKQQPKPQTRSNAKQSRLSMATTAPIKRPTIPFTQTKKCSTTVWKTIKMKLDKQRTDLLVVRIV